MSPVIIIPQVYNNKMDAKIFTRRRRNTRIRRRRSLEVPLPTSLITTLLLSISIIQQTNAGLSIGGVTSTDSCYAALQNAQTTSPTTNEPVVDQDGYVQFINELSNNAFTSFQYNSNTDEWGQFPVTNFNDLPSSIREEFYTHACGGAYTICAEAYLYTEGTGDGDMTPSPQQEVYLYQVCTGVEDAIDAELALLPPSPPPTPPLATPKFPTYAPTDESPPTNKPIETTSPSSSPIDSYTGQIITPLIYNAAITEELTSDELNNPNSLVREHLLATVMTWSSVTRDEFYEDRDYNEGTVTPVPFTEVDGTDYMKVIDVACNLQEMPIPLQPSDHCIQIATNLTLQLTNEPSGSQDTTKTYFEDEFNEDIQNTQFYLSIVPESTQQMFRHLYLPSPDDVIIGSTDGGNDGSPTKSPTKSGYDADELLKEIQGDSSNNNDEGGGTPVAGIAAGVSVGLVALIVGLFIYRKRRRYHDDWSSKSSNSSYNKKEFDPSNDLERGDLSGRSGGSQYSSRYSSHSQSSGSIQSYSGSESWSRSSRSSASSQSTRSKSSHSYLSGSYTSSKTGSQSQTPRSSDESSYSSASDVGNVSPAVKNDESANSPTDTNEENATQAAVVLVGRSGDSASQQSASTAQSNSTRASKSSRGSDYSDSESENSEGYLANVNLMDEAASKGSKRSQSSSHATPKSTDDSSAGSSGWDSSDGDSSVDTGSVDSYDPNTIRTGDLDSQPSHPSDTSSEADMVFDQDDNRGINPAHNPVVQPGVTMLPIEECSREEEESTLNTSVGSIMSDTDMTGIQTSSAPLGGDIQEAIEAGDWEAVGATAELLATKDSSALAPDEDEKGSSSVLSSHASSMDDEDDLRAREIDQLVETGNWDGVVAVAARYADEADEADDQLERPLRSAVEGSPESVNESMISKATSNGSVGSVSVESPGGDDETSVFSKTTRDSMSHTTYSVDMSGSGDSSQGGASTRSGTTPTPPENTTHSSSITSSFVSRDITSSMVSAASSVDQQEKRQMNAYRAEVEALVRRVVPDEIDNVDDIMVQFSGREEELIETLRAMQEKSIAQRARAAVQRSAKREAGKTGRTHNSSEDDLNDGATTDDGSQSYTTDGRSGGDSITEQFTEADSYSSGSSYSSASYSTRGSDSQYSHSQTANRSLDAISEASGLSGNIDAGDWTGVQRTAKSMQGAASTNSRSDPPTVDSKSYASKSSHGSGSMASSQSSMDELINSGDWSGIIDKASEMRGQGGNAADLD